MTSVRWPIPYGPGPNAYEIVGRFIAQTVQMERFLDLILLDQGAKKRDLKRAKLSSKIKDLRTLIERSGSRLEEWRDLPDMMVKVAQSRNLFAHRLFERGPIPRHYGQGIPYAVLSDEELAEQEREAFQATDVCLQLSEKLAVEPLNPGLHLGRTDLDWAEVLDRHGLSSAEED